MNEFHLVNTFVETPIAIFFKHAIKNRPFNTFCASNNVFGIPDLPFLLFESNNIGPSFENKLTNNVFVPPQIKTYVLAAYVESKKQWWTIRRAVVRYARRRRRSQTSTDLSLEPFGALSTQMDVFDQGKKYTFKISDLLNLIHNSLTRVTEFICCEPVAIKNPYTGLEFGKPTLYSIYLMLRESSYSVPPLFGFFLEMDFDLKNFSIKYETILRDYAIKSYVDNLTLSNRRTEIRNMFSVVGLFNPFSNKCEPIFRICVAFSEELDQFTPWLHLYFLHLYSLNTYYAHISFRKLVKKMLRFREENPTFGMIKGKKTKKLST